jgi:uncharacterized protein YndB with AHSA1/START domain
VQAASAKKKKTGWVHTEKGYRYRRSDGTWVRNTWKKIDGKVYYFEGSYTDYEANKLKRLGLEEPKRIRYRKLMED